jgi:hypothetical protein
LTFVLEALLPPIDISGKSLSGKPLLEGSSSGGFLFWRVPLLETRPSAPPF